MTTTQRIIDHIQTHGTPPLVGDDVYPAAAPQNRANRYPYVVVSLIGTEYIEVFDAEKPNGLRRETFVITYYGETVDDANAAIAKLRDEFSGLTLHGVSYSDNYIFKDSRVDAQHDDSASDRRVCSAVVEVDVITNGD